VLHGAVVEEQLAADDRHARIAVELANGRPPCNGIVSLLRNTRDAARRGGALIARGGEAAPALRMTGRRRRARDTCAVPSVEPSRRGRPRSARPASPPPGSQALLVSSAVEERMMIEQSNAAASLAIRTLGSARPRRAGGRARRSAPAARWNCCRASEIRATGHVGGAFR
jgi:hypothetical protein